MKWWTHVSSMVMNRREKSALLLWNIAKPLIKTFSRLCYCSLWANAAPILRKAFSITNFQSIYDKQHFLKCLPCLLARALLVDGHPIPFYRFYSHFCRGHLILSTTAMFVLEARMTSFKLCHLILSCCKRRSRLSQSRI